MYESMTFESIMSRCLSRVSTSVDKREGSIIYDAIAPAAAELAMMYVTLSTLIDRAFVDTARGQDLARKAIERGIFRIPATAAIRKGTFTDAAGAPFIIPVGSRFSGGSVNYAATELIVGGQYKMAAETPGQEGNNYIGPLLPINHIPGLGAAILSDILIPGQDEESDASLLDRYMDSLNSLSFGGNVADYKEKVRYLPGVGGVKVVPVWNGGGTVKIIIIDSTGGVPSATLVDEVQTMIDPTQNQGVGLGLAPIGHVVTVAPAVGQTIDIGCNLTLSSDVTWEAVLPSITQGVQNYFDELIDGWDEIESIIVRVSQIETRILNVFGVIDITNTTINGVTGNIALNSDEIPMLGDIINGT